MIRVLPPAFFQGHKAEAYRLLARVSTVSKLGAALTASAHVISRAVAGIVATTHCRMHDSYLGDRKHRVCRDNVALTAPSCSKRITSYGALVSMLRLPCERETGDAREFLVITVQFVVAFYQ